MALGYETYEDNRDFKQEGLTGDVRRYTTTKMEFPCYVIVSTPECEVELYKIQTVKRMFETVSIYNEDDAKNAIHLYFNQGSKTVRLGKIQPKQVKTFLKLFESNIIDGYYDKDTLLSGEMLYVLSD